MNTLDELGIKYQTDSNGEFLEFTINSPKYGSKVISIDKENVDILLKYKWYVNIRWNKFYVKTCVLKPKRKNVLIHRLIMNVLETPNIHIDHRWRLIK